MTQTPDHQDDTSQKKPFYKRFSKPGKNLFWVWVGYQCVKGLTTTTFIWAPLIYMWWHSTH